MIESLFKNVRNFCDNAAELSFVMPSVINNDSVVELGQDNTGMR
jgi:hypothetical protein